jgi:hypothetical protein
MLRYHISLALIATLTLLLAACQPITPMSSTPTTRTPADSLTVDASQTITQEETMSADSPMTDPNIKAAAADLSHQSGAPLSEITVVSFEAVTWPDGSLGCPQPDMAYAQVLVDGARIRLEVDGEVYEYHSGGNQPPFLCENPTEPAPGSVVPIVVN